MPNSKQNANRNHLLNASRHHALATSRPSHPTQGFQTVCTVASLNFSLLQDFDAENISLPLTWAADPSKSRSL